MKEYKLCLLGFGNVGRALAQLLATKSGELRAAHGIEWKVTGVATRRMGWIADPDGLDVSALLAAQAVFRAQAAPTNVREWLRAAHCDVLFELSSVNHETGQPAIDHIRAGLEAGAHVITANKGPMVHAYHELRDLAAAQGRRFLFEATVMGGTPVFSLVREALPVAHLLRFRGILNSTTTRILAEMEAGCAFDEAVERAQALGITETDPSADVDGWDAALKVATLVTVLMDTPLKLAEVEREGIRGLRREDVQAARASGRPFRLVGEARCVEGQVVASVRPQQLLPDDPLAGGVSTASRVHFEFDTLPGLTISGSGQGPATTAYGLLADFVTAVESKLH